MILAKLFLITTFIFLFGSLLRLKFDDGIRIIEKIIVLLSLTLGIIILSEPNLIKYFSDFLNIGRPADLIFYIYIIFSFWFLLRSHIRINKLESKINNLISYISLIDENKKKE